MRLRVLPDGAASGLFPANDRSVERRTACGAALDSRILAQFRVAGHRAGGRRGSRQADLARDRSRGRRGRRSPRDRRHHHRDGRAAARRRVRHPGGAQQPPADEHESRVRLGAGQHRPHHSGGRGGSGTARPAAGAGPAGKGHDPARAEPGSMLDRTRQRSHQHDAGGRAGSDIRRIPVPLAGSLRKERSP